MLIQPTNGRPPPEMQVELDEAREAAGQVSLFSTRLKVAHLDTRIE